jgi:hypothetical protein
MANARLPDDLARWLIDHHGVVTTATLRSFGIRSTGLERLVDSGFLRRLERGSFALATAAPTLEHRCRVLCCAHPAGFVTGPTAGMLGGLRRQPNSVLHFATLHGRRLDPVAGVRFRQTTVIAESDRVHRPDGIVVASWTRLAFDLAGDLRQLDHRSVVHQLLERRLVTVEELAAIGRRLSHPARRGSTTFRRTLATLDGEPHHDSHPELVLRDALVARGVPVRAQVPVTRADGVVLHVDLGVAAARWGVELDIHPEHRSVEGHQRDSARVRSMHGTDWQIEPVSELDMTSPATIADALAALYRQRAVSLRVLGADPGRPSGLGRGPSLGWDDGGAG